MPVKSSWLAGHWPAMENALATSCGSPDHRHAPRTHLFVVATLCWDDGWARVHIRNMSVRGALIDTDVIPFLGKRIVLKRGSLEVGGVVAWASAGHAGLAFSAAVREADWMIRRASAHQDRVDEIVAMLKADATEPEQPAAIAEGTRHSVEIETELASLRSDLAKLGDSLSADVILVATHPEIQLIDVALQRVGRIMSELKSSSASV